MKRLKQTTVPISTIQIGERFRKDPGDLESLAQSIHKEGLINPVTIDTQSNLLAGFRRLSACTMLNMESIPVTIYKIDNEYEHRIVELVENIQRKELNWSEQANLVKRINEQMKKHMPGWTQFATANLLKMSPGHVSDQLMIAEVAEQAPEIEKISSFREAVKAYRALCANIAQDELSKRLQDKAQSAHRAEQGAKSDQPEPPPDPYLEFLAINAMSYHIEDVFDGLLRLHEEGTEPFDYIEIDPPYNVSFDSKYNSSKQEIYSGYSYKDFIDLVVGNSKDLMRADSFLLIWFPTQDYTIFRNILDRWFGPKNYDPIPAIWYKNTQPAGNIDRCLAWRYEAFFAAWKGKPVLQKKGLANVFEYPTVQSSNRWHPVQRPLDLMLRLHEIYCPQHGRTLVPFAGSGTTLNAHYLRNPIPDSAIGFDINADFRTRYLANLSYPPGND